MWGARSSCFLLTTLLLIFTGCKVVSGDAESSRVYNDVRLHVAMDQSLLNGGYASIQSVAELNIANTASTSITIHSISVAKERTWFVSSFGEQYSDEIDHLPPQINILRLPLTADGDVVTLHENQTATLGVSFLPRYPARLQESISRTSEIMYNNAQGIPWQTSTPHERSNLGYLQKYQQEKEENYLVKTYIIIETSKGTIRYPLSASSIRKNRFGLPDTVTFQIRLPKQPFKQFDCFDLHISNPAPDTDLNVWQASFSKKSLMELRFDVGYSQSPNANPHARVNPEWRGQGAQVLAGGAEEVYMATLCARAFSEDSEDSSDPVIDKEVPDNGFRDISLGYLQVLMPDEKLFIWMQLAAPLSLYPDDFPARLMNGMHIVSDNGVNFEPPYYQLLESIPKTYLDDVDDLTRMPPFPELPTRIHKRPVQIHPSVADVRMLPSVNETLTLHFDLENTRDYHVSIMSETSLLPSASTANSLGFELVLYFESVPLHDEPYDFGPTSRILPPHSIIKDALTLVCKLNTNKTLPLLENRTKPVQYFGEILFHATYNVTMDSGSWKEQQMWNPMKESHLNLHLPYAVTAAAGEMFVNYYDTGGMKLNQNKALSFQNYESGLSSSRDQTNERLLLVTTSIPFPVEISGFHTRDDNITSKKVDGNISICDSFEISDVSDKYDIGPKNGNVHTGIISVKFFPDKLGTPKKTNKWVSTSDNVASCYLDILFSPVDATLEPLELRVYNGKVHVMMKEFEYSSTGIDLSARPTTGLDSVFSKLETSWIPVLSPVLSKLYRKKDKKELARNEQEQLLRKYLSDLGGAANVNMKSLDPALLEFGATGDGETQAASLYLTNWNPTPVKITIDVSEVQGMSIGLGRDSARKKGDRNSILDFLPDETEEGDKIISDGEWAGHTRNGLRRYLLTSDLARSFFTTLSHRDAVVLNPLVSKTNHHLKNLYSESMVNVTFHSDSLLAKEPLAYGECTDPGHPAMVISSDLDTKKISSICKEHEIKEENMPVVSIPPGGVARFEVKLRALERKALKKDVSSFLATGLVLSTDTGQVIPLIASYEVLLGQLKVSNSPLNSESNAERGEVLSDTIEVPIRLFEDLRIDDNRTTNIRIPPENPEQGSSGFHPGIESDSYAVPLFLTSTFSGDVCLKKIESCSPLFKVVLEEKQSKSPLEDAANNNSERANGLNIGDLYSFMSCVSSSSDNGAAEEFSELPEFPSFYQCALKWLENRSSLQPRGCGAGFQQKGKNTDDNATDSLPRNQDDAIERAIVAFKNAVSYLSLSYGGWREFNARLQQLSPGVALSTSAAAPTRAISNSASSEIEGNSNIAPAGDFNPLNSLVEDGTLKSIFQDALSKSPGFEDSIITSISTDRPKNINDGEMTIEIDSQGEANSITPTSSSSIDNAGPTTTSRMKDSMKSGSGRGDGTVSLKKINMFAEASDAWKVASEFGLNVLSTSLRATIGSSKGSKNEMSTTGGCGVDSEEASHSFITSIQGLTVETSLETPRLFDRTRSKQQKDFKSSLEEGLSSLDFPPTLVSNVAVMTLPLRNPTSVPVRVRLAAVSAFGGERKVDGEGDEPSFKSVRDNYLATSDGIYIQNRKANMHEDYGGQLWWEGGGAFFLCDDEGNMIQSHHNLTIRAGAGAQVSLMNPSLHGTSAFLLGCGTRCGDRETSQDGKDGFTQIDKGIGVMPKRFTPIGAAAASGSTLLGQPRGSDDDIEELLLGAGGAPPTIQGPAPFAVPYSALDEIILPPHGEGELGPILFRPPGRRSVLGCDFSKDSGESQQNIHEACQKKYFESLIFLENSLTGLERVVLRGQGLWERVEFRDAEPDGDEEYYGDIEFRHGHSTLVFPGTGESEKLGGTAKAVVKRVVVHNSGDTQADFRKMYFSDAAIGHLIEPGSLHESRRDKNTLEIGREGDRCDFHNFRLLGCEDRSEEGFSILPGHNRTLYIEHRPDCALRQEYIALNLEYRQASNSSAGGSSGARSFSTFAGKRRVKANVWEKSFRKSKISLLVGFDMDQDTMSTCTPVQQKTVSPGSGSISLGSLFEDRDPHPSGDLKHNGTYVEQVSERSNHLNGYLEALFFVLVLIIAASRVASGVHSRWQWCSSFRSGICSSAFQKGEEAPKLSTSTDSSDWSAAFRCLARADPSSSDLQLLGREQVRQVVANRYKSMGIIAPQSLTNFGSTLRDRPGRNTAGGSLRTGKEGAGGEKIRTLSDAIFQDFVRDTRLPCGLGWRAAAARGIGSSSEVQMPQKVRELQMRRHGTRPKIEQRKLIEKQVNNGDQIANTSTHDDDELSDNEGLEIVGEFSKPIVVAPVTKQSRVSSNNLGDEGFSPVVSTSRSHRHVLKKCHPKSSNDDDSTALTDTRVATKRSIVSDHSEVPVPKVEKAAPAKLKLTDHVDAKLTAKFSEREQRTGQSALKARKPMTSQRVSETKSGGDQTWSGRIKSLNGDAKQVSAPAKETKENPVLVRDSQSPWGNTSQSGSGSKSAPKEPVRTAEGKSKTGPNEKKITILQNPRTRPQRRGSGDTGSLDDSSKSSSVRQPRPKRLESSKKKGKKNMKIQTKPNKSMQQAKSMSVSKKKKQVIPPGFPTETRDSTRENLIGTISPSYSAKPSPPMTESPPSPQVTSPAVRPPPGLAPPPGFAVASISSQGSQNSGGDLHLPSVPSIEEPNLSGPDDLLSLLVPRTEETGQKSDLSLQLNNYTSAEPLLTPLSVQSTTPSLLGELGGNNLSSTPSSPMVASLTSSIDRPPLNDQSFLGGAPDNGFNVMDFLDSILDEPQPDDEESPDSNDDKAGSSLPFTGTFKSDPWAGEKKSRASAYGIAVEESNDQADEAALVHGLLADNSTPLLTPASILGVTQTENAGGEEEISRYRTSSFHQSLLGE